MKSNTYIQILVAVSFAVLFTACSTKVAIENVNFAQPVETVVMANNSGEIADVRTGISFNVGPLLENEGLSLSDFNNTEVRMIRNHQGYYFVTASGFRNVYVMKAGESELKSENIINVSSDRMDNPALNQRNPYIQLVYGDRAVNLSQNGIQN